jgi:tetratricopeptide (TPR) repeat protein
MLEFGACPRCKQDVSPDRRNQSPVICNNCGYIPSTLPVSVKAETEKRVIAIFAPICALVLFSYIQLMTWDSHSIEILPLAAKQTLGISSVADNDRYAEICMDLKKWDCVEINYAKVAAADPTKLPRLGNFQMKRAKYNEAAQSYFAFFKSGGNDLEASYNYAKALAQLGQVDEATKYFEQVLAARPDVLQVTVVQNYVKLLLDHQRYEEARKLIADIRSRGPETGSFMEAEYQKIKNTKNTASR